MADPDSVLFDDSFLSVVIHDRLLLTLQWCDIDFKNLLIMVEQSATQGQLHRLKTDVSKGGLPLDPDLAEALLNLNMEAEMKSGRLADAGLIFPGWGKGKPLWKNSIFKNIIKPAAPRAGIANIGWHKFRHTFSTQNRSLQTPTPVQKGLMRHSNILTTLGVYTHAVFPQ